MAPNESKAAKAAAQNQQASAQSAQKQAELGLQMMLNDLREAERRKLEELLTRAVEIHEDAPHTPLPRPLSECTLAVVTSAGLHRRGDEPFGREDPSYRVIPSSLGAADVLQSHSSLAFDKTAFIRDINVVFPLDRVRELVADGRVGRLGPNHYSFMGALHPGE